MRVTLIEDDDLHAEVVSRWLASGPGVRFERFSTADAFFAEIEGDVADLPDLVFVDYHLGEATGADFIARLRAEPAPASRIGVVLFSGLDSASFFDVMTEVDADGFLLKDELSREKLFLVMGAAYRSSKARSELVMLQQAAQALCDVVRAGGDAATTDAAVAQVMGLIEAP